VQIQGVLVQSSVQVDVVMSVVVQEVPVLSHVEWHVVVFPEVTEHWLTVQVLALSQMSQT
jgi:hypothetical protein